MNKRHTTSGQPRSHSLLFLTAVNCRNLEKKSKMDRKREKSHLQYTMVSILQHKACVILLAFYWAYIKLGFMEVNFPAYS